MLISIVVGKGRNPACCLVGAGAGFLTKKIACRQTDKAGTQQFFDLPGFFAGVRLA
ncbi:hypothetical protein [Azonexus fungiphilus]|uniref:hypothetical protein n=1 Tax=Azonexus fungiphilus TaxID=146940 RepID=UPI00156B6A2A|nr:hypothetical protein [Azonexus fungiphilus]NHC07342.1 hypothetical protein [Azonexus fungiphilus]